MSAVFLFFPGIKIERFHSLMKNRLRENRLPGLSGNRTFLPDEMQGGSNMLGMCGGVLNLPQPRLAIGGVVDNKILASVFASDRTGVIRACVGGPRANLNRHRIAVRIVADDRFHVHGLKLRSQNALWTVSPSASTTTRSQRCRDATQLQSRSRPS